MKNRFLALLLVLVMMLPMAACGSTAAVPQQDVQASSQAEEADPTAETEAVPAVETETAPAASAPEETADTPQKEPNTYAVDETEGITADGDPIQAAEQNEEPVSEEIISNEPYIPENLENAVIGYDDRVLVLSTNTYPFSCIAYMEVEAKCGCSWTGTGFMVSKYTFMTASHCLNCVEHDQPYTNITCYFGYRSPKDYLYKVSGMFSSRWGKSTLGGNYVMDNDYAYLLFTKPVGDTTGWLGYRVLSDSEANNEYFYAPGYRFGVMKFGMGDMIAYNDKLFIHYIDDEPGYSGGPICDEDFYAVGINIAEDNAGTYNIARRITDNLISQMYQNGLLKW